MSLTEFLRARITEAELWAIQQDRINTWHEPFTTARVLAECEAKRRIVADLLDERHLVVQDCWYTCVAATDERDGGESCAVDVPRGPCDCGRDDRIARRLGILALPYADHPDYGHIDDALLWRPEAITRWTLTDEPGGRP